METVIMSAKESACRYKEQIREEVSRSGRRITLGVVMVGGEKASIAYADGLVRDFKECGMAVDWRYLDGNVDEERVANEIRSMNRRRSIDGVMVQLPLPRGMSKSAILNTITPTKDVDCQTTINAGRLAQGCPFVTPCTPTGVLMLLDWYHIQPEGKHCVVIGRSDTVGKPLAAMLTARDATVTLCHSATKELAEHTRRADMIVCAAGRRKLLTADMVKDGAVVVDVGINFDENGKMCGDVDFESVAPKCSAITPVPGGVGLMTRVALMKNVVRLARPHGGSKHD